MLLLCALSNVCSLVSFVRTHMFTSFCNFNIVSLYVCSPHQPTNQRNNHRRKRQKMNFYFMLSVFFVSTATDSCCFSLCSAAAVVCTHSYITHTHAQIHLLFCFLVVFLPLLTEIAKENTKNEMKLNCKITRHILPLNLLNSI